MLLSKPCHVGIHWITLAEYSQMSTQLCQGFRESFLVLGKLATSSIRVNPHVFYDYFGDIPLP